MGHARPAKRRRLTPPIDDSIVSETIKSSDLFNRAADWDLEQEYEQASRRKKSKESNRLPIKTSEGRLETLQEPIQEDEDSDSFLGTDSEGQADAEETPPTDEADDTPQIPLQQQVVQAKEEIARLAGLLNEDPEEHASAFKKLAQIASPDAHPSIQRLALAAQAAVYKDVIPGYRIRAYKEEDMGSKVSKEVRQTRNYEQALVLGYQNYVKTLSSLTKKNARGSESKSALKTVALNCACTLLLSVPHFNFRTELLAILTREMLSREPTPDFVKSVETIEKFFEIDEDGAPSLEAVNVMSKMMKAKDYRIREEVLNTLLHLRLLSELSAKSSTTRTDKPENISKLHGRKVKKDKWEHRSKKERKVARERKVVEKDMKEATAAVDYEAREKMQSETLKQVFVVYFRILKARTPELIGAVLEGLAKYAHLINQEFFGDILEALKDIINQAEDSVSSDHQSQDVSVTSEQEEDATVRNHTRESLLSTQTAFTLLSQQEVSKSASALHLDLSFFTSHVYRSLYPLTMDADIELGPKSLHLLDPHQSMASSSVQSRAMRNKVNISTPILLLTRVLTSILLSPSSSAQSVSPLQVSTFLKRLLTTSLQTPEKSTLSLLSLLLKVMQRHAKKVEPLWYSDERKGDGTYRGDAESVERTNVFATGSGVWEGELLRKHYVPGVREGWTELDKCVKELRRG